MFVTKKKYDALKKQHDELKQKHNEVVGKTKNLIWSVGNQTEKVDSVLYNLLPALYTEFSDDFYYNIRKRIKDELYGQKS